MHQFLLTQWQKRGLWAWLTLPLSGLVCLFAGLKRRAYRQGWLKQNRVSTPVIVIGNLSVGGSGKTPLVAYIAHQLKTRGYQPGIICRGYKGSATSWPQPVVESSDPKLAGDEAVMLARQTRCPIMAGPNRFESSQILIDQYDCDVILSDDGFQHLKLARDIDVVVIDTHRGLGNRWCLPSGPLRESSTALNAADMLVMHDRGDTATNAGRMAHSAAGKHQSYCMLLLPGDIYALNENAPQGEIDTLRQMTLHAIAGIGHPGRFFDTLRELGFTIIEHAFPDHHHYTGSELKFDDTFSLITTEKDAIKLAAIKIDRPVWVLPVTAKMQPAFKADLMQKLQNIAHPV